MDVKTMIRERLEKDGFDGLFNAASGCACKTGDLAPCGNGPWLDCEAGHLAPCDGSCESGECDWHIQREKPVEGGTA